MTPVELARLVAEPPSSAWNAMLPIWDIELVKTIMNLGALAVLTGFAMWLIYRLADKFGEKFVGAIVKAADAMSSQAECVSELKDCVKEQTRAGGNDHREIILGQQVIAKEMQRILNWMEKNEDGRPQV